MSKERHELVSEEYFEAVSKEAEKLLRIAKKDGFTIHDVAVIGMLIETSAVHTIGHS